jgi:magnesium transporter
MLINCAAYQDGRKLGDIDVGQISDYLQRPNCFVWVAVHDAAAAELSGMQQAFGLHPLAVEDAQTGHQRPKIEEYGDSLCAVLHIVEPHGDELNVGELAIFAGRNYVLSVRNNAEKGFQDVRARSEREPDLLRQGPGYILYALMDAVVDRYFPLLDRLEDELDVIEQRIFAPEGVPREKRDGHRPRRPQAPGRRCRRSWRAYRICPGRAFRSYVRESPCISATSTTTCKD